MRRNIRLLVSYDGTDFAGWQVQPRDRSVQGVLEEALSDLHGESVNLIGAGRTDSGVHATGQVGNFYTGKDNIPDYKFTEALNTRLPKDVRILSSREVPEDFHSRRSAINRQYEYHLLEGITAPAHLSRYTWLVRNLPSVALLNDLAGEICGVHDFSTFTAAGDASDSRVREIRQAVFFSRGPQTVFRISGNAFLWKMVRSVLGTLIDTARTGGDTERLRGILDSQDREQAGPTAPAHGLFLTKVTYGSDTGVR